MGLSVAICAATHFGLGRHEEAAGSQGQPHDLFVFEYIFTILYVCLLSTLTRNVLYMKLTSLQNPALMATKTSILIFYLSLSVSHRVFRWTTIMTLVIVNIAGLALTFLNIFVCRPMSVIFINPKPDYAHCTDIVTLYLSSAPVNIVTDLFILLLPMPVLKSLRLPRKQKIILYITFGFGVFVTAVDVVRISYLQNAAVNRLQEAASNGVDAIDSNNRELNDFSWYAALSFMWSAIEVNVGIMCACVPALKPLVVRFLPSFVRDTAENTPEKRGSFATMASQDMAQVQRIPSLPAQRLGEVSGPTEVVDEGDMSFMDFLSAPDMNPGHTDPKLNRNDTVLTNLGHTRTTPTFFDFVNMGPKKPITRMNGREAVRPIAQVTILFFLWGFAYGLSNTLNARFQAIAKMTTTDIVVIHSCYYAGYLVGPLTLGRMMLRKWGFKACYMVGLVIWGTGSIIFWPAAVLTSFPAFVVSNFIVGVGLSSLEVAANPFIALCGPPRYMESRLCLSQAIQAIGTVFSLLISSKVLFKDTLENAPSLIDVQWTYLAICLFAFLLAFVYFCIQLPEASDAELELAAESNSSNLQETRRSNLVWITLGVATFAQFMYVGGQEAVGNSLAAYVTGQFPTANADNYSAVAHGLFSVSRFAAALFTWLLPPRYVLAFFSAGLIVFSVLAMNLSGTTANIMVVVVIFFEGPLFCLIFAIPLRGLGKRTKDGSVLLTAAICGGGVFAPIYAAVATSRDEQYAYCVVVAAFACAAVFAVYCNVSSAAIRQIKTSKASEDEGQDRVGSETTTTSLDRQHIINFWPKRRSMAKSSRNKGSDSAAEHLEHRQRTPQQGQQCDFITAPTGLMKRADNAIALSVSSSVQRPHPIAALPAAVSTFDFIAARPAAVSESDFITAQTLAAPTTSFITTHPSASSESDSITTRPVPDE